MSKRGMRFHKRGISPLIATVLLIAFAVSIGTMIMNWGKEAIAVGDCTETKIEIQQLNGKDVFCYDTLNNKVNFMVKNSGSTDVETIELRIIGQDLSVIEKRIESSEVKSGSIYTKSLDFTKSGNFRVEVVPVIVLGGKEKICSEKIAFKDPIPSCN